MDHIEYGKQKVYRNVCPRNCYATCSMLSYVENGILQKVMGDRKHGYTEGKLCAKGYAYTQYVYSAHRLKYPLLQSKRGSGNWKRISWDEAFERIADKMLELNQRYGSNLALGYNSFAGNLGLLHYSLQGMFQSFGPHTHSFGDLCTGTGREALRYNVPFEYSPPPERMAHANLIVLWGANPSRTNIHQMKFILRARDKGAVFVVIDPIFTETARLADIYIQIRPGMDGYLIMGMIKLMLDNQWLNKDKLMEQISGWDDFLEKIEKVELEDVIKQTGVVEEALRELSYLYTHTKPAATWIGFGLQRRLSSIQDIRAIDALTTVTENRFILNGGLYYFHPESEKMPLNIMKYGRPNQVNRAIDINHFAEEAIQLHDPPLKFLWFHAKNPLSQDQHLSDWYRLLEQLEMVVTTDLYMSHTAKMSDIVLPATTHFEEMDLNVSYWNHWLSLNQQAIEPYYEAKSDLEIVRGLVQRLNHKVSGFSSFPYKWEAIDWIKQEIADETVQKRYGIHSWEQLLDRPYHLRSQFYKVGIELEKREQPFTFYSEKAIQNGLPALPIAMSEKKRDEHKFTMLSPQTLLRIHSQFDHLSWLNKDIHTGKVLINETAAKKLNIKSGEEVIIYNENGEVRREAVWDNTLPENTIVLNQGGDFPINLLIGRKKRKDLNQAEMRGSSPFYEIFVSIRKAVL